MERAARDVAAHFVDCCGRSFENMDDAAIADQQRARQIQFGITTAPPLEHRVQLGIFFGLGPVRVADSDADKQVLFE